MGLGVWLHVTERHGHEHARQSMDREHAHVYDERHRRPIPLRTPIRIATK